MNAKNAEKYIDGLLHKIIDEEHEFFTAITDEELIEKSAGAGIYTRSFSHQNGKSFKMKWKVVYGYPEPAKTIFYPAEQIK